MFHLNDKVVYPGHGVAKINKVVEKIVAGQVTRFFELQFLNKDMTVLVPIDNLEGIGIRSLSSADHISKVFQILAEPAPKINALDLSASNWNKRNKEYQFKLRTGDINEIMEIYRDLKQIALKKELSFGEKSLLQQTEHLLAEEISIVQDLDSERAAEHLRSFFAFAQTNSSGSNQKTL